MYYFKCILVKELYLWVLKKKLGSYYTEAYLKKYGDRITQVQGNVISAKVEKNLYFGFLIKLQ
ncbi:hypothetical protein CFSAN002367_09414 [Clostridium botulinum CFSAN002367]|nr:hypothetical protein CFSAN002369_08415 [Clostridium botulinum CFSAN002369]EPS50934.1 hypothetical protein CFSAN002367_09414 [Clostridium botulinum CFSAN002367]